MRGVCLLAAASIAVAMASPAQSADPLQLQKSVRTLAALQDRAADGDAEAARLQSRLISQIESDIRLTPKDVLGNPHNLRAIAMLLLSGANPNLVEAQTLNLPMDETMRNLISGALAYARADREGAAKLLGKVEVRHLPPSLAGRVALVRSIIGASDNTVRAIDDLYRARELMPGTLVEEASLRRCVAFAGKLVDKQRLHFCSARYMRRFPKSLYFAEFEEAFAGAVAQTGLGEGNEITALLESLRRLKSRERRQLLLRLSRAALTHGRHELATRLAREAQALALAASVDMARSRLYLAAAAIAGEGPGDQAEVLAKIEAGKLDSQDARLLADVRRLAGQIASKPDLPRDTARQIALAEAGASENEDVAKAVKAARAMLKESEKLFPASPRQADP